MQLKNKMHRVYSRIYLRIDKMLIKQHITPTIVIISQDLYDIYQQELRIYLNSTARLKLTYIKKLKFHITNKPNTLEVY